jgi:hypothetical protein
MAAETQYTANTGMAVISTANSGLDGSGTLGTVLTAGSNGTLVKSVTIKAQVSTTQGMVRLFIYDGTNTRLVSEIEVPAITKSSEDPSFECYLETDFSLKSGEVLKASTQNAESFNVIAEGLDWAYYATSVRSESTNYTATMGGNSGGGTPVIPNINSANTALDGTGTLGTNIWSALDAGVAASGWNGCSISSITIKATGNTTAGMVRLFINDGTNTRLLTEVPVRATTQSSVVRSFSFRVNFNGNGFMLKAGYKIYATTEKSEGFNIVVEAADWKYPA